MAEIKGLLLTLLFLAILVIGSIAIVGIGAGLIMLIVKIVKKLNGEKKDGDQHGI